MFNPSRIRLAAGSRDDLCEQPAKLSIRAALRGSGAGGERYMLLPAATDDIADDFFVGGLSAALIAEIAPVGMKGAPLT